MDKQAFCHWISVDDALPDAGDRVIATDGNFVGEAYMIKRAGNSPNWMRHYGCSWVGGDVIAWTPMPLMIDGEDAYRPVSREQIEKVWRGEWTLPTFAERDDYDDPRLQCSKCGSIEMPRAIHRFCPMCGAPMTDEAVELVLKRLEAMKDGNSTD